jgi:hypothetical protein
MKRISTSPNTLAYLALTQINYKFYQKENIFPKTEISASLAFVKSITGSIDYQTLTKGHLRKPV